MSITNTKEIYPSIYISPTIDNTETLELLEAGAVCGVGYFTFGNPHYAVNITDVNIKLKTINTILGGSIKNETAYHVRDNISIAKSRVLLSRILGADSTLSLIKYKDDELTADDTVNIFGDDNITEWADSTPDDALEILTTLCPEDEVTIDVDFDSTTGMLEIKLFDRIGNLMYSVSGHIDPVHEDDNGDNDFIGNITDGTHMMVKTIPTDDIYNEDFSATKTFNGLVTDSGDVNVAHQELVLEQVARKSDYMASLGVYDTALLQMIVRQAKKASISTIIDVKAKTIDDVEAFITELGEFDSNVYLVWDRASYKYKSGVQNIGVSGWIAGQNVNRNLSNVKGWAEYRLSGIAGVNFPLNRTLASPIPQLTDDEKTRLTKLRVNTVEMNGNRVVISDVLSTNIKNTQLTSFPVADALRYIKRTIGRIEEGQLYKNLAVAKSFINEQVNKFLTDCRSNAFFDNDVPLDEQFEYWVTDEGGDTVVVKFEVFMEGVMRKGEVRSVIKRKG